MAGVFVPIALTTITNHLRFAHGRLRELTPVEADVLTRHADAMLDDIKAAWPFDTGFSRALWSVEVFTTPSGEGIRLEFFNNAEYAEFVRPRGHRETDPFLWEELIPAIWLRHRDALNRDVMAAIDRTEAQLARPSLFAQVQGPTDARNNLLALIRATPQGLL